LGNFSAQLKAIALIKKDNFKNLLKIKGFENVMRKGLRETEGRKGDTFAERLTFGFSRYSFLTPREKKDLINRAEIYFQSPELAKDLIKEEPISEIEPQAPGIFAQFRDEDEKELKDVVSRNPRKIPVGDLAGVGKQITTLFRMLGIETFYDFLSYFPFRYEDRSNIKTIGQLEFDKYETFKATVVNSEMKRTKRGRNIFEVVLKDDKEHYLKLVYFHRISNFLSGKFKEGHEIVVFGKVEYNGFENIRTVAHPEIEELEKDDADQIHLGRIVPVYSLTKNLTQKKIRTVAYHAIKEFGDGVIETLPKSVLQEGNFMPRNKAFKEVHFPTVPDVNIVNFGNSRAHQRLKFEEMFLLQCGLLMRKRNRSLQRGKKMSCSDELFLKLREKLGFELTEAQQRVIHEIRQDMDSDDCMNRLLQGDVGSGKTAVAIHTLLIAVSNGYQAAMMAPTEILAFQHYVGIHPLLESLGYKVVVLTAGVTKKEKEELYRQIEEGEVDIVLGTHAVIEGKVKFKKLGLVIVDEQHKFGVKQRAKLVEKGDAPELLVMTATPIPRTLTLTLFGDLAVSVIDQMPAHRKPIQTSQYQKKDKKKPYKFLKEEVTNGRQGYILFPLVEESELIDLQAAEKAYEELSGGFFSGYRLGLLHGRMKNKEKEEVMSAFKKGELDILVSTTVIEVGIDVPNATVMIIEHTERFGLSQLHQLRGRVGRGSEQSYCFLLSYGKSPDSAKRVEVMVESTDGFYIAEKDLEIRGPGDFLGTKQSGMPDLKWVNIIRDHRIVEYSRVMAEKFINQNPELAGDDLKAFRNELADWWEDKASVLNSG